MKGKILLLTTILIIPKVFAADEGIFRSMGRIIYENQLPAIILILLCILFGYVLGRFGRAFRRRH